MAECGKGSNNEGKNVLRAHYKMLRPAAQFRGDEMIVSRHSETIAEVFPDWIERCKLDDAYYHPFDLKVGGKTKGIRRQSLGGSNTTSEQHTKTAEPGASVTGNT
ncbi:hypothetical protein OSTOST_01658 [Ostertagia ostertagi]